MPDFLTIQRQHNAAKLKGLMSQDSSLADFAKLGALATGDPSYQQVADSPAWKNMIRGWSANVDEAIQSGPIDDWTAEAFGKVGDVFGVTPEASRDAGRELPRQVMNFLPMMGGAAVGGAIGALGGGVGAIPGAAAGAKVGLGLTSALSAFDAYGKSGEPVDAAIGAVAPYLGTKLAHMGTQAVFRNAATPGSVLSKLGFLKGKNVLNPGTFQAVDPITGLTKTMVGETVDKLGDKALGYLGGQVAANAGFLGMDVLHRGPEAVLNKDYLFASLASNVAFGMADIPRMRGRQYIGNPVDAPLVPTQEQINAEKTRGERTRESLEAIDNSLAKFQKEAELGVDIGRFIDKNNQVAATMEGHRTAIKLEAESFQNTWNQLRQVNSALPDVLTGIDPKVLMQNPSVIGFDPAKALVQEYAQKLKQINKVKGGELSRIAKSDANLETVMGLVEEDLKLPETLLNTPVTERTVEQYQKALGTKLSDNAVKLIRMKHMEIAQGESFVPEFPKLWEEHNKALTGKFEGSINDRYELITASLLAGKGFPKVVKAQKKAVREAKTGGQTKAEANKEVTAKLQREVLRAERAEIKTNLKGLGKLTGQQLIERLAAAQRKATDASHPLGSAWARVVEAASAELAKRAADPASKPKVGAPKGPRKATLDKSAAMEERINRAAEAPSVKKHKFADNDAGPAHSPVDEATFLIAASFELSADPKARMAGLSWLSEVMANHAGKPWADQFAVFKEGLKTAGRHDGQDENLIPINTEVTPNRVKTPSEEADAEDAFAQGQREAMEELVADKFDEEDSDKVEVKPVEPVEAKKTLEQERDLLLRYLAAASEGRRNPVASEVALAAISANKEQRAMILEMATRWEQDGFPQLAARDVDPRTVSLITGQPLPIKEFATAWAREAGVPEAEIPAAVDDFVRITQMFAAGEARFGTMAGVTKEGAQFARASSGDDQLFYHAGPPGITEFQHRTKSRALPGGNYNDLGRVPVTGLIHFGTKPKVGERYDLGEGRTEEYTAKLRLKNTWDSSKLGDRVKMAEFFGEGEMGTYKESDFKGELLELIPTGDLRRAGVKDVSEALRKLGYDSAKLTEDNFAVIDPTQVSLISKPQTAQFARASAGAFDFGMREVKNGQLQRPGKPPLGTKDGWMQELDFRNNGGDINGVLTKDEVNFYRELVPEAFADGKVHLQKLWDGLGKVGEQVKVVSYGQEGGDTPAKLEYDRMTHEFYDPLNYEQSNEIRAGRIPAGVDRALATRYIELRAQVMEEIKNPRANGPRATTYYNQISPFDTKKFPVVRVDVVLPGNKRLWQPDNLHENLPNTLGWAMVQIVPHPVTGEKVMFVGEAQSRWGQTAHKEGVKKGLPEARNFASWAKENGLSDTQMEAEWKLQDKSQAWNAWQAEHEARLQDRYKSVNGHPLLPIHQNLILKAVIKEAQKQGVSKVAVSDGETAMMTEGHDKAGLGVEVRLDETTLQKAQLAYTKELGEYNPDPAYLSELKSILDDKVRTNNPRQVLALRESTAIKAGLDFITERPSQEGGMRLAYDTTLPSIMSKLAGGEGKVEDFGVHKNARDTGSPVFRTSTGTPKTNATARVYDITSPSDRLNTLFAKGGTIYGAAFKDIAQAFFSTKAFQGPNKTKAMGYVLAHEMGHIAFGKAMRGEYGPETKQLFDEAIAWVKTNDPAVLRDVEEIIRELYLPKEMKNLDGVRDVLGNLEPEEWMANAHAMMVTGAMQANKPIKALLLLPKPIRTMVENTIRRVQDALKHARMYWKLSGDKNKMNQVLRVKDMVDSVRQKFREAEWQTAQAMEFLDVNPAGLLGRMENVQFARSPYPVEGVRQKLGNFFNNATQGLGGFMATYKSFVEPGFRLLNSGNVVTEQVSESLTPIFGHKGATDNIVVDKSLPWFKLANSKPLYDLTKRINLEAQDSKVSAIVTNPDGTVSFNWLAMSPEHRAEVKLYNPEQQKAMAQFLMQKEQSTRLTQKHNVEHETNKARMFAVNLVTRMKSFDQGAEPALRHKEARVVAEKLFNAMQAGDQVAVQDAMSRFADPKEAQKLVDIIQEKQGKLLSLTKFYADQPNFQSLRRFKPIIQRYTDANGASKVLDFNKGSEALAMRKELEAKGWKAVGDPITRDFDKKYKSEFTVDSKVVDLLESKEGRLKDLIDSMDIDPADRDALLGESSFLADVLREAKSNDIYLPGVKRRISGGPEHLDMLEQHLTYTQAAHKVGYMTALGEELKYHMNNPELKDQLREKTQFMEFYKQAKESDPKFWRVVNKANAVWHIGFNLPGHLVELFQPIQTHIHEAVYQGHSMLTALRTTVGAEKDAMAVIGKLIKSKVGYHDDAAIWENWKDKDEAAMLKVNWRRSLTQPLQEVYQQVGVNQETLRGIVQDREMLSPSKILTKPLNVYSNAAMGLYSVFTQHNNLVGLLTGYRLAKKKGLSHDEAVKSAALFELTANNSGGRTERPVYFGKLGSAGYLVYALSSYVRGRFTDLARYYRHGFDKVNFPELNQSDRRAARQAFASMIAGQLAAAGILGFPFVGAGIALMEDLTGDEIKGQGLNALNEMTDDPLLTQALSYGVMSSMAESLGIPADLHSRFALGGFMGLNAYDGISAASVLGPTASMVNSMWKMGKSLVQEKDLGAAFRAGGPGGIKRMSEALSEEFQAENPDANLPMAMAGFRSGKMFKNKEMERIISKTNEVAQNDIKLAARKVEESLLLGPEVAQKTLMREANLLIDQKLEGRGRQVALKDMMSNLRQRIALQKVKEQMPSDIRGKATAQTAGKISSIAQAIGYQPPPAGNVEQEQIMKQIYSQLGGHRSPGSMRRARERQMELEREPGAFY